MIIVGSNNVCLCRPYDAKNPFLASIKVNRELHKSGDRSCMHIEFDIEGSKMRYDSGKIYRVLFIYIDYTDKYSN